jgi:hypothetical protein
VLSHYESGMTVSAYFLGQELGVLPWVNLAAVEASET